MISETPKFHFKDSASFKGSARLHLKALDAKEKARIIKPYVDSLAAKEVTLVTLRQKVNTLQTGNVSKQKTIENL